MSTLTECDYLIVGGGSAGCIVARRLADAGIGRVVLLEAGKSDEGDPAMLSLSRMDEQSEASEWGFQAMPHRRSRSLMSYDRARVLGGCGNHNDCAFLMPPGSDFDHWQSLGAVGWGAEGVRPYFERVNQMVHVDQFPSKSPVSRAIIETGVGLGLPEVNFRRLIETGVGWFPLNSKGDLRQSASVAYLHPLHKQSDNLQVMTETMALRLVLQGSRVVACETSAGTIDIRAEVILTAGSIQSPQLLMVSGIGPGRHLQQHGIDVQVDLPGVGQNLSDHVASTIVNELKGPVPEWEFTPFEATMLLQMEEYAPAPDILFHFGLRMREKYGDDPRFPAVGNGIKVSPNVTRPCSRGSLTLTGRYMTDAPCIDLNFFSDPDDYDLRTLVNGTKFARTLIDYPPLSEMVLREVAPGPEVVSDEEVSQYVLDVCETVYHPAGTCAMGNADAADSVVAPNLKVKGVQNLWVGDASVFPAMVTVNINNSVMMVAEKAADLVLGG